MSVLWPPLDIARALASTHSLQAFDARKEHTTCGPNILDGFWSSAPYFGFLNTFKYPAEKVVLDKYTIVEARRVRTVYNWLQYFSVEALGSEIESRGFEVSEVLGDVAGARSAPEAHEFAVVARKTGDA